MRAYKTVNDSYIEPISFTVPRRAESFQADIFPPAPGTTPAVGAQEWLNGKTGIPAKIDLESIYEGGAPKEIASDYKPAAQSAPAPTSASSPTSTPAPTIVQKPKQPVQEEAKPAAPVARGPPPSMNDQKSSIAAMANKYQDNEEADEEEDVDDASSFEEVSRPAPRATARPVRAHVPAPAPAAEPIRRASPPAAAPAPTTSSASAPSVGVEASLNDIKQLLEQQARVMAAQNTKIDKLVGEVESLKKRANTSGSQDQSERIRLLELELEEARS